MNEIAQKASIVIVGLLVNIETREIVALPITEVQLSADVDHHPTLPKVQEEISTKRTATRDPDVAQAGLPKISVRSLRNIINIKILAAVAHIALFQAILKDQIQVKTATESINTLNIMSLQRCC